jgi:hypothetical protein
MSVSINSLIFFVETGREYRGKLLACHVFEWDFIFQHQFQFFLENLLKKIAADRASQQKKWVAH